MGDMPIRKLLFRLSPPVMLALLIQSVYNIVDSYFVAQYSLTGLTALSLVFPIQQLATALATGAGTGLGIPHRPDGRQRRHRRPAGTPSRAACGWGCSTLPLFACVTLAWVFHFAGLTYVWLTFPVTEVLSVLCALVFYRRTPFPSKRRNAE